MTRRDLQRLARIRLNDARTLLRSGNSEGAYYITGLAVECALKAVIARRTQRYDFPPDQSTVRDIYTHDLVKLIKAAGLETPLASETARNRAFDTNWGVVKNWNVNSRYMTAGLNARDLYRAVNGRDGVMPWLRRLW